MELLEAANIMSQYNDWRRLKIKRFDPAVHDNVTEALKRISSYVFWNQENKQLKPHADILELYNFWRTGKLKEEPVSFASNVGETLDFVVKFIKENHNDKKCV